MKNLILLFAVVMTVVSCQKDEVVQMEVLGTGAEPMAEFKEFSVSSGSITGKGVCAWVDGYRYITYGDAFLTLRFQAYSQSDGSTTWDVINQQGFKQTVTSVIFNEHPITGKFIKLGAMNISTQSINLSDEVNTSVYDQNCGDQRFNINHTAINPVNQPGASFDHESIADAFLDLDISNEFFYVTNVGEIPCDFIAGDKAVTIGRDRLAFRKADGANHYYLLHSSDSRSKVTFAEFSGKGVRLFSGVEFSSISPNTYVALNQEGESSSDVRETLCTPRKFTRVDYSVLNIVYDGLPVDVHMGDKVFISTVETN